MQKSIEGGAGMALCKFYGTVAAKNLFLVKDKLGGMRVTVTKMMAETHA